MAGPAVAPGVERRVFLVGDDPRLVTAVLRQAGLRLVGQVPDVTLLLPLLRDCPADILLLTTAAFEDWPPDQALPRVRALNPRLRLAVVLDTAAGIIAEPDWQFAPRISPAQIARALLAGPVQQAVPLGTGPDGSAGSADAESPGLREPRRLPAGLPAGPTGLVGEAPPRRLLRLFVRPARDDAAGAPASPGGEAGPAEPAQSAPQGAPVVALPPAPQVLAVFGPKGGAGKTTVAVNLAAALARLHPGLVLLVDLNLRSADVGLHLDLLDGPTLMDALPFAPAEEAAALLPYVQQHQPTGLRVVLGPPRVDLGELVRGDAVSSLVRTLQQRFPIVILDLGAGSGDDIISLMRQADRVLLVSTLDPAALRQAKVGLEALRAGSPAAAAGTLFVANRVPDGGSLTRRQVEGFLGIPIAVELPDDTAGVGHALAVGEPAILRRPDTEFAAQIEDLMQQLGLATRARPRVTAGWLNRLAWR